MSPLVSIIMPAYNAELFIEESIKSVINQTYKNWELIIVDDCSTDNTKNIMIDFQKINDKIKTIFLKINSGKPSIAKNFALKESIGKYIAFLDSDDIWCENKLEKQVQIMESNSKYGLCYTGGYWIDKDGNFIKSFLPKYSNGNLFKNMLVRYEINNQSVMIRRESLEKTIIKFNEIITIGEDYNLYMNILNKYEAVNIKEYLIKYRIHNNAITKNKKRISDGVILTLNELDLFKKYPLISLLSYFKALRFKYIKKTWK